MAVVIFVLIVLVAILLMGVILVQNSKGGGLSADFTSSNQYMGVRKTADFLEKATWGMAIGLFALCLLASAVTSSVDPTTTASSEMVEFADEFAAPNVQSGTPVMNNGGATPPADDNSGE